MFTDASYVNAGGDCGGSVNQDRVTPPKNALKSITQRRLLLLVVSCAAWKLYVGGTNLGTIERRRACERGRGQRGTRQLQYDATTATGWHATAAYVMVNWVPSARYFGSAVSPRLALNDTDVATDDTLMVLAVGSNASVSTHSGCHVAVEKDALVTAVVPVTKGC